MSWSTFVFTVLPAGALLVALLASGQSLAMRAGSRVLSAPIRIGNFRVTVAVVMVVACGVLSCLSYSGLRRAEFKLDEASSLSASQAAAITDQLTRNVFYQGRNLYISLLGLTFWLVAWRLKALHDCQQLLACQKLRRPSSPMARGLYLALALALLLLADVPLCRINYQLQLAAFVTPRKDRLMSMSPSCENTIIANAAGPCADFCSDVRHLSEERLSTILWARQWHLLGRVASELFDGTRGVQQGRDRIDALFRKKTCAQVLRSIDKSNVFVNCFCIAASSLSILGAFAAFSHAFGDVDRNDHRD